MPNADTSERPREQEEREVELAPAKQEDFEEEADKGAVGGFTDSDEFHDSSNAENESLERLRRSSRQNQGVPLSYLLIMTWVRQEMQRALWTRRSTSRKLSRRKSGVR